MSQVLSQSEVDALLAAVSEGEIANSDEASGGVGGQSSTQKDDRIVVAYDLGS